MTGKLHDCERYQCVLIYEEHEGIKRYLTLMMTDSDLEKFRERSNKNREFWLPRPLSWWRRLLRFIGI